jgi:NAD(P)-dependent dehydrogenase (short-subunit alcohol dehydrogenase family)
MRASDTDIVVLAGAGSIAQAIARRIGTGKHVVLADLREQNVDAVAKVMSEAGFEVSTAIVDGSSRESVHALVGKAAAIGSITELIHSAGVSPTQESPSTICKVDLYGTAVILEEFGNVIAHGGSGVVIASQSGHRLAPLTA